MIDIQTFLLHLICVLSNTFTKWCHKFRAKQHIQNFTWMIPRMKSDSYKYPRLNKNRNRRESNTQELIKRVSLNSLWFHRQIYWTTFPTTDCYVLPNVSKISFETSTMPYQTQKYHKNKNVLFKSHLITILVLRSVIKFYWYCFLMDCLITV